MSGLWILHNDDYNSNEILVVVFRVHLVLNNPMRFLTTKISFNHQVPE